MPLVYHQCELNEDGSHSFDINFNSYSLSRDAINVMNQKAWKLHYLAPLLVPFLIFTRTATLNSSPFASSSIQSAALSASISFHHTAVFHFHMTVLLLLHRNILLLLCLS